MRRHISFHLELKPIFISPVLTRRNLANPSQHFDNNFSQSKHPESLYAFDFIYKFKVGNLKQYQILLVFDDLNVLKWNKKYTDVLKREIR